MTSSELNTEDIYNTLSLIYNEHQHDAFRDAVTRFMEDKFGCDVIDHEEYVGLEADAKDASDYWNELEKTKGALDTLRDDIYELTKKHKI